MTGASSKATLSAAFRYLNDALHRDIFSLPGSQSGYRYSGATGKMIVTDRARCCSTEFAFTCGTRLNESPLDISTQRFEAGVTCKTYM